MSAKKNGSAKSAITAQPDDKKFEADAREFGRRLGYLISMAPVTDEARMDMLQTVPFMDPGQLEDLTKTLEAVIVLSTGDRVQDDLLAEAMRIVDQASAEEKERAGQKLDATMDDLEAELAAAK